MKKRLFVWALTLVIAGMGARAALAANINIQFPVAELGGCADQNACKAYCDDPAHGAQCLAYARANGLVDEATAARAEALAKAHVGPGGCTDNAACRQYCADQTHQTECLQFAVDHGMMTREQAAAVVRPGGCRGDECRTYCANSAHYDECAQFAADNGLVSKDTAARARQIRQKIKESGGGPGGCADENACRAYCADANHRDECVAFGRRHGLIDAQDVREAQKAGLVSGPGGCQGVDACRTYCDDAGHQQECVDWASQNGLISKDDAARAKKFIAVSQEGGPGGCRGDGCRTYCADPAHTEECLSYAQANNLISPADAARAKKFIAVSQEGGPGGCRGDGCRTYCADPNNRAVCFDFAKKNGLIGDEEVKQIEAGQKIKDTVRQSGGPGGCTDDNTCRDYCGDPSHVEECVAYAAAHGGVSVDAARTMLNDFTRQRARAAGDPNLSDGIRRFQDESENKFEQFRQLENQFRGPDSASAGEGPSSDQGLRMPPPGMVPDGGPGTASSMMRLPQGPQMRTGPGGCASPSECIKYCAEHMDVCFGGGSGGSDGNRDSAGDIPRADMREQGKSDGAGAQNHPMMRLRNDLMRPFAPPNGSAAGQDGNNAGLPSGAFRGPKMQNGDMPSAPVRIMPSPGGPAGQDASARGDFLQNRDSGERRQFPPAGFPAGGPPPDSPVKSGDFSGAVPGGMMPLGGQMPSPGAGAPPVGAGSSRFSAPSPSENDVFSAPPPSGGGSSAPPPPLGGSGESAPPPASGLAPIIKFFGALAGGLTR
jgi:hypothetical protein